MFDEDSDRERQQQSAESPKPVTVTPAAPANINSVIPEIEPEDPLDRFLYDRLPGERMDRDGHPAAKAARYSSPYSPFDPAETDQLPRTGAQRSGQDPGSSPRAMLTRGATGIHSQIEVFRENTPSVAVPRSESGSSPRRNEERASASRPGGAAEGKSYSERLEEIYGAIEALRLQLESRTESLLDRVQEGALTLDQRIADSGLAVRDRLDDIYARSSTNEELLTALRSPSALPGHGSKELSQLLGTIEQGQQKLRKFVAETTSASDIAFQQFTVAFEDFVKELHEAFTQLGEQIEELTGRPAHEADLTPIAHAVEQCTVKLRFLDEAVSRLQVAFVERSYDHKNSLTLGFSILLFTALVQIGLLAWIAVVG